MRSGDGGQGSFASGTAEWRAGLGRVRDQVRQELVARELARHLPPPDGHEPVRVLDVGCGQGSQAIRMARAGYDVTGVDVSAELLAVAAAAAAAEPAEVGARLRFALGDLLDLTAAYRGRFQAVCCHGVLMYLPSLEAGVAAAVGAARPGGIVSVLTRNRAGIAMRAGMTGQWASAVAGFDARLYRNRLGIDDVRADEPDEVDAALAAAGADRVAWYGVRLFSDHWGQVDPPEDMAALVVAEQEAGRRDPYRQVSALTHTVAIRRVGQEAEPEPPVAATVNGCPQTRT